MNAEANRPKWGVFTRRVIVLPALVVALSLAYTGAASAQTPFQASVTAKGTHNGPGCSGPAAACGTANIVGYGTASWDLIITGFTPTSPTSASYSATTDFRLTDGSTLEVNESGVITTPYGYTAQPGTAFGHPNRIAGQWTVVTANSTGQFTGATGTGTDTLRAAGARLVGSYNGTLG
jgi:hypothetical protein